MSLLVSLSLQVCNNAGSVITLKSTVNISNSKWLHSWLKTIILPDCH